MENTHPAPALLRKTWLPVMLAVELIPAFMGSLLLFGVLSSLSWDTAPWVIAYFTPGLSLYVAKFMVMTRGLSAGKSQRIMRLNGCFAAITFMIGISWMVTQQISLISEGGWFLWLCLIYLACASTISFLASTGKYELIR